MAQNKRKSFNLRYFIATIVGSFLIPDIALAKKSKHDSNNDDTSSSSATSSSSSGDGFSDGLRQGKVDASPRLALAKSDVAGGYDTGFARGVEEAHKAIAQFNNGHISTIDGNKPPPCPLADKQDDYCDGWKDGWEKTVVKELD